MPTLYALSGRDDSRPPCQGHGGSDGTLENSHFVRLSASDFSRDGRAVLSLGKDPGIIDLSAQLSQPMSE
jgi:hypothetical protein